MMPLGVVKKEKKYINKPAMDNTGYHHTSEYRPQRPVRKKAEHRGLWQ